MIELSKKQEEILSVMDDESSIIEINKNHINPKQVFIAIECDYEPKFHTRYESNYKKWKFYPINEDFFKLYSLGFIEFVMTCNFIVSAKGREWLVNSGDVK
jgi:hypothetical protein